MQVIKVPDDRLRIQTKLVKKINSDLLDTTKKMIKLTKSFTDPEGVGLASTQIGHNEQFFVIKTKSGAFESVFNPKILKYSKRTKVFTEGCLSIPDLWGEVTRSIAVTVEYINKNQKNVKKRLTGLEAHIFQHEFEHLQGKLFVDKVLEQKSNLYRVIGKDRAGLEIFEKIKL